MLAILTVLGTIGGAWGGQWIAARRDDRRWEREAAREELRWQREVERTTRQNDHDMIKHWSEVRLATLKELLTSFEEWRKILGPSVEVYCDGDWVGHRPLFDEDLVTIRAIVSKLEQQVIMLPLVVSRGLDAVIRDAFDFFHSWTIILVDEKTWPQGKNHPVDLLDEAYHSTVEEMKKELGLDIHFDPRTLVPAPQSATNS